MDAGSPVYYDPNSFLDYSAVVATSLAMMSLSMALLSLAFTRRLAGSAHTLVWIPSLAAGIGGLANLLEDGFGLSALGFLFGVGSLGVVVGLFLLAGAILLDKRNVRQYGVLVLVLPIALLLPPTVSTATFGVLCLVFAFQLRSGGTTSGGFIQLLAG